MIAQKTVRRPEVTKIAGTRGTHGRCRDRKFRLSVSNKDIESRRSVPLPAMDSSARCRRAAPFFWMLASFLMSGSGFGSETLRLTPGMWQIKTSTRLPAMSQSISRQYAECIQISDLDPTSFFDNPKQCSISEKTFSGNAMNWQLECTVPGKGRLQGRGNFASHGDRAEGSATLTVFHEGTQVEMITHWSGRRIGACP